MKLVEYKKQNRSIFGTPGIRVTKSGTMVFNQAVVECMGLKVGDKIAFAQDQESPSDFYMRKTEGDGAKLRENKKTLFCNMAAFAKNFLRVMGKDTSVSVQVGSKPAADNWYAIITRSLATRY